MNEQQQRLTDSVLRREGRLLRVRSSLCNRIERFGWRRLKKIRMEAMKTALTAYLNTIADSTEPSEWAYEGAELVRSLLVWMEMFVESLI